MAIGSLENNSVKLFPNKLSMTQNADMSIFRVANWYWTRNPNSLSVEVVLKRKITSEMMTTFFPSLLLIAITFATTFFKTFFFEAALSVNLTTMLVMTTIFISKMESLPPTSDIRMIDIWLVFCQIVPFAEVLLLTAMEYNRTGSEDGTDNDNDIQTLDKEKIGDVAFGKETIRCLVSECTPSWKTLGG